MKYRLHLFLLSEQIVTLAAAMTERIEQEISSQPYTRVERYGKPRKASSSAPRRKTNSFSAGQTPEKGHNSCSLNYSSDTSSSYVQSSSVAKKYIARRSLSTSPTLLSHYAGAKFSEPPEPSVVPLPPVHWTESKPESVPSTPGTISPFNFEILEQICMGTPNPIPSTQSAVNQSVELFFQKCSFNQMEETTKDFTKQLKTLLNVPA